MIKLKKERIKIPLPDFSFEREYQDREIIVAGVDEAGRGALAGPVYAGAIILPVGLENSIGINDSKKLSAVKRIELFEILTNIAVSYSIGYIDNIMIDDINILKASMEAMRLAVESLKIKPQHLLIDGNYFKGFGIPFKTIIKGDSKSISIASASILAKVARDKWMVEIADKLYPEYNFAKHKGYGTQLHFKRIEQYGLSPIHRRSFLKRRIDKKVSMF